VSEFDDFALFNPEFPAAAYDALLARALPGEDPRRT